MRRAIAIIAVGNHRKPSVVGKWSRFGDRFYHEAVRGTYGSIVLCYRVGRRDAVFASARQGHTLGVFPVEIVR